MSCRGIVLALLVGLVLLGPPAVAQPADADLACDQEPGHRFYWVERAFCDLPMSGPERAIARGERAQPILGRRGFPYLMIDETSEISGHQGGVTGRFALRYGFCLVEFLAAAELPPGRFTCPPPEGGWTVARELLMPAGARKPGLAERSTLPASVASLAGPHWALAGDTLVLVAPVTDPRGVRLLYRSTSSRGGVFDATITEGSIQATVSGKSTVTLSADAGGTITLTSSDSAQISAPLRPVDWQ